MADNFVIYDDEIQNDTPSPIIAVPIDRVDDISNVSSLNTSNVSLQHQPLPHQLDREDDETSNTKSNEDDDIKYFQEQEQEEQKRTYCSQPPPGFGHIHKNNNYYQDSLPSISPQQLILNKMMFTVGKHYHEHNNYLQYHEGPIRVTNESPQSKSSSKSNSNSSSSSTARISPSNSQSRARTAISRRTTGSTRSEEPEYYDGQLFREKYKVGNKINEGGFGSVWKIRDNALCGKCVKIMDLGQDRQSQNRRRKACIREYKMTEKAFTDEAVEVELYIDNTELIEHPSAYLIMPYFDGKDLFEFIDDEDYFKKVEISTMLHIFYKILEKYMIYIIIKQLFMVI